MVVFLSIVMLLSTRTYVIIANKIPGIYIYSIIMIINSLAQCSTLSQRIKLMIIIIEYFVTSNLAGKLHNALHIIIM